MTRNSVWLLLPILLLSACSSLSQNHNYQPLGTAVLTANNLLVAEYPEGPPAHFSSDDYKNLLKKDYRILYDRLQPYQLEVERRGDNFIVNLYDRGRLIMKDASCTETRIDCWVYKQECDSTTFHVPCLEPDHSIDVKTLKRYNVPRI